MMTEDDWIPISKKFPPPNKWLFVVYQIEINGLRMPDRSPGSYDVIAAHTFMTQRGRHVISGWPSATTFITNWNSRHVTHWMIQPPLPKK
jgi:hypothetical protein